MKRLVFYSLIILLAFSCGSKKKSVEKEKTKIETTENSTIVEKSTTELTVDKTENKSSSITEIIDNNSEEIEADSSGTVTVRYEKTDNGYTKTYNGVKNIKINTEKKETKKKDTVVSTEKLEKDIEASKTTDSSKKSKIENSKRSTDVEIKRISTWFWIIVLIAILLYIVYRKLR